MVPRKWIFWMMIVVGIVTLLFGLARMDWITIAGSAIFFVLAATFGLTTR